MSQPIPERPEGISTLAWLQDEVHLVKAQLAKIQHQMDQTQALVLDIADKVRQGEAALGALAGKISNTSQFQEDIRQVKDVTARLQEQLAQGRSQVEEVVRQRLAEGLREGPCRVAQRRPVEGVFPVHHGRQGPVGAGGVEQVSERLGVCGKNLADITVWDPKAGKAISAASLLRACVSFSAPTLAMASWNLPTAQSSLAPARKYCMVPNQ